jgi:hypothetical protein
VRAIKEDPRAIVQNRRTTLWLYRGLEGRTRTVAINGVFSLLSIFSSISLPMMH